MPVLERILPHSESVRLWSVLIDEVWQLDSSYKAVHEVGRRTFELVRPYPAPEPIAKPAVSYERASTKHA